MDRVSSFDKPTSPLVQLLLAADHIVSAIYRLFQFRIEVDHHLQIVLVELITLSTPATWRRVHTKSGVMLRNRLAPTG